MDAELAAQLMEVGTINNQEDEMQAEADKEINSLQTQIDVTSVKNAQAFATDLEQLKVLNRQESSQRLELFTTRETLQQAAGR